ncbi:MAG: hypothetical protein U1D69_04890 [Polynucleobacter sp.]|jgi:hypothetical protein|nr:hypothetical protein [Polynucleobacter sp.]
MRTSKTGVEAVLYVDWRNFCDIFDRDSFTVGVIREYVAGRLVGFLL